MPFAGRDGGGQQAGDDPGDVEHDLGFAAVGPQDRFLDHGDRAVSAAEGTAVRVGHDATSSQPGCVRCGALVAPAGPGGIAVLLAPAHLPVNGQ